MDVFIFIFISKYIHQSKKYQSETIIDPFSIIQFRKKRSEKKNWKTRFRPGIRTINFPSLSRNVFHKILRNALKVGVQSLAPALHTRILIPIPETGTSHAGIRTKWPGSSASNHGERDINTPAPGSLSRPFIRKCNARCIIAVKRFDIRDSSGTRGLEISFRERGREI